MVLRVITRGLVVAAAIAPLGGCSPTIAKPRLASPGNAPSQRYRAEHFDPYPQNDMAPEIVGGRPPDYMIPPNEVERARQFMPNGPRSALPVLTPQLPVYAPPLPTLPTTPPGPPPVEYRY
jgi:hypothetical protein